MMGLLADSSPFEVASKYLTKSTERADFTYFVGAGAGLLLTLAIFSVIEYVRKKNREVAQTDGALSGELSDLHGLDRQDRVVVDGASQLAPACAAAMVFLDPERLDRFSVQKPEFAERAERLRRKLFGSAVGERPPAR